MKLTNKDFEKWKTWVNKIKNDLQGLVHYQQVYEGFIEMVEMNTEHIDKNEGDWFCYFVKDCYLTFAAIAIRRHTKINDDSISLMRLLDQLKENADHFTYDFYLQQYPVAKDEPEWQNSTFATVSENKKNLSECIICKDMRKIRCIAGGVSNFTDRVIAHLDKRGFQGDVTYNDLAESIKLFNKIACKYIKLITGGQYSQETGLRPEILGDWKKIFRVPMDRKNADINSLINLYSIKQ